jgi:hypothetical protein
VGNLVSDFSQFVGGGGVDPYVVCLRGRNCLGSICYDGNITASSSLGNNYTLIVPFTLSQLFTVKHVLIHNAANNAAYNVDVGIYDVNGNKQVTSGSTSLSTADQSIAVSTTTLIPGKYFFVITASSNSAVFSGFTPGGSGLYGAYYNSGTVPLGSTITLGTTYSGFIPDFMLSQL